MYQIAKYSDIGGRSCNEDSVCVCRSNTGAFCVIVADGLGGHGGGDVASAEVCRTVSECWNAHVSARSLAEFLNAAGENVKAMQTNRCPMKSTAVVLAVKDGKAAWVHVGDSRLYHFLDGKLVYQTKDHSASQLAVLLGDIEPEQIRFHEDRARLTRALGQSDALRVEIADEWLVPGNHAFLLCTDGFWEYVLEHEMEEDLRAAIDPEQWLNTMRQRIGKRAKPDHDNNTAAVVWLKKM